MKKYIGLDDMSNVNCASVLSVIMEKGEISRKDIAEITSLSWGGMTKIVNKLFENGYIVESKSEKQNGLGRTPNVISINKSNNFVIGLDINRMGLGAYIMNLAGEVVHEYEEEGNFENKESLLQAIISVVRRVLNVYQDRNILGIGIAMQGILDAENGISNSFPGCSEWENVPIRDILKDEFNIDAFVEHDPNCMLYSLIHEDTRDNTMLLRIDSSVGMAVFVNGEIVRGNGLFEIAHQIVVPDGNSCMCGQKGCLEAYIAPCFVNKKLQMEAVKEMIVPLSIFISNMCRIFNTKRVILTGDMMKHHACFDSYLLNELNKYNNMKGITVEFVGEANHAIHGAALIAVQMAIEQIKI